MARQISHQPQLQPRSGQVFLFFLTLTTISLLMIVGILSLNARTYQTAQKTFVIGDDALYLAEAGIDKGIERFIASPNTYTGETFTLGSGTITTSLTNGSTANEKYLIASAKVNNLTKRIRVKLVSVPGGSVISFKYAMQAGTGGFSIGNGSQISGNAYSNGNITGSNGSAITGSASAVGTITGVTVGGTKKTGVTAQALPTFNASFWQAKAQEGGTITGDYMPTTGSVIGPKYVTGKLIFDNSVNISVAGPIYAAGGISFGNSPVISVDNSLGAFGVMLATDGKITFGNSIAINSNSSGGDLLLISTNTADDAISIGNGALTAKGPMYAPNGGITMGNSTQGVAFAANKIILGNNAIATYDSGLANESYTTGPSGTWAWQRGSYEEY